MRVKFTPVYGYYGFKGKTFAAKPLQTACLSFKMWIANDYWPGFRANPKGHLNHTMPRLWGGPKWYNRACSLRSAALAGGSGFTAAAWMRNNGSMGIQYYDFSDLKLNACGQDTTTAGAPKPATGRWHQYDLEVVMNNNASRSRHRSPLCQWRVWHRGYQRCVGALWQKPGALWVPTFETGNANIPNRVGHVVVVVQRLRRLYERLNRCDLSFVKTKHNHPPGLPITGSVFAADRSELRRKSWRVQARTGGTRPPVGPAIGRDRRFGQTRASHGWMSCPVPSLRPAGQKVIERPRAREALGHAPELLRRCALRAGRSIRRQSGRRGAQVQLPPGRSRRVPAVLPASEAARATSLRGLGRRLSMLFRPAGRLRQPIRADGLGKSASGHERHDCRLLSMSAFLQGAVLSARPTAGSQAWHRR